MSSRIGCANFDDKRLVLTIKNDPSSPFQQILKYVWLNGDISSWEINLFRAKGKITILFTTEFLVIPSQEYNIKAYKILSKYTMRSKSFEHFH